MALSAAALDHCLASPLGQLNRLATLALSRGG